MSDKTGPEVKRILRLHERQAALLADSRFGESADAAEARQFVLAVWWGHHQRIDNSDTLLAWIAQVMGWPAGSYTYQMRRVYRADVPRFDPLRHNPNPDGARGCRAVMDRGKRAGQRCGQRTREHARVTDPATGAWQLVGYCRTHTANAQAAQIAERVRRDAGGIPEPAPNTGGLLPCYLEWDDWPDRYSWATGGTFVPPAAGIRANDWPVMAKVAATAPPKLAVVTGGRTSPTRNATARDLLLEEDLTDPAAGPAPHLRLVPYRDEEPTDD